MRPWRAATLLACMLVLAGVGACADGCRPSYRPPHLSAGEGVADEVGLRMRASAVCVALDGEGRAAAAARDLAGGVFYFFRREEGWLQERVVDGSLWGRPALAHSAAGDALVAAVVRPDEGPEPPVAALNESPDEWNESEGDLILFTRRGSLVWRSRKVASRALLPSVAAGEGRAVHLAFLQPSADGLFVVVYVRLDGESLLREEVGRRALLVAPDLVLVDGVPVVTYAAYIDGPAVLQARGTPGGAFEAPRALPTGVLGEPPEAALALAWRPEGEGGRLALVRRVSHRRMLHPDGMRAMLDPLAKEAVVLSRVKGETIEDSRIEFTTAQTGRALQVVFGDSAELIEASIVAGGSPLFLPGSMRPSSPATVQAPAPRIWLLPSR